MAAGKGRSGNAYLCSLLNHEKERIKKRKKERRDKKRRPDGMFSHLDIP
jgi:hypothetical protein